MLGRRVSSYELQSAPLVDVDLGRQIARDFEPDCLLANLRFVPDLHDFFSPYVFPAFARFISQYAVQAKSPNLFSVTLMIGFPNPKHVYAHKVERLSGWALLGQRDVI
jgi:hypothetical protein